MTTCNKDHRYWDGFKSLPYDQGGFGRHKCAGCAYEAGYRAGLNREEQININLDALPESQAGTIRHKSPHAAFAEGYRAGIEKSYEEEK
jgi:hypothetical protein